MFQLACFQCRVEGLRRHLRLHPEVPDGPTFLRNSRQQILLSDLCTPRGVYQSSPYKRESLCYQDAMVVNICCCPASLRAFLASDFEKRPNHTSNSRSKIIRVIVRISLIIVALISQWKNFKLVGLRYLVFILKFELFWPWLLGKRVTRTVAIVFLLRDRIHRGAWRGEALGRLLLRCIT